MGKRFEALACPTGLQGREKTRRRFLGGLLGGAALAGLSSLSMPAEAGSKLQRVERTDHGTTLFFHLDHAPYGNGRGPWSDPTVIVFVPAYYRLPKGRRMDAVVHFHGHNATAYLGISAGRLREQLAESLQNAILVVPQLPVRAVSSEGGRLDDKRGFRNMMKELARELKRHEVGLELDKCSVAGNHGFGHLAASAHSGGYKVLANCLKRGGLDIKEVYLFDALYGEVDAYRRWVIQRKSKSGRSRHKLISHYAPGPAKVKNLELMGALKRAGVKCHHEEKPGQLTRKDLAKGRAIFIQTPQTHGGVTFTYNNLRDCLYASGFKRFIKSDWFENKNKPRKIERRG